MRSNCICNAEAGTTCAHHAYLTSLDDVCECGDRRGHHIHPKFGGTKCLVSGGCKQSCEAFKMPNQHTEDHGC